MAFEFLRRRRDDRRRHAAVTAVSVGGIATGAALFYALMDPRRRDRAASALRGAEHALEDGARALGGRATEAAHGAEALARSALRGAQARAEHALHAMQGEGGPGEQGRGASEAVRRGREELERRAPHTSEGKLATAGGVLVARALLAGGLLRIPAGLLGASLLGRAVTGSRPVRRSVARTRDAARAASGMLHDAARSAGQETGRSRGETGTTTGGVRRRPRPEVREVKSPAELDPGIASGRPDPTFRDRVDRSGPHMDAGPRRDARPDPGAGGAPALSTPGTEDVARNAWFDGPSAGGNIREGDLGVVLPHEGETAEDEDEDAGRRLAPGGEDEPPRRAASPEDLGAPLVAAPDAVMPETDPAPRILGPGERPVHGGHFDDEGGPARITGPGTEDADVAPRREPGSGE